MSATAGLTAPTSPGEQLPDDPIPTKALADSISELRHSDCDVMRSLVFSYRQLEGCFQVLDESLRLAFLMEVLRLPGLWCLWA